MTVERTIERPRVERSATPPTTRRSVFTPIAIVAALIVGLIAGFALWGTDDTDVGDAVAAGGVELTARQEQMVDLIDDYVDAWQNGDGDAVAAMFAPEGSLTVDGTEFPVEDGQLAGYVDRTPTPGLDTLEPVLMSGNTMFNFHTLGGENTLNNVMEFTVNGELLIISHEISG